MRFLFDRMKLVTEPSGAIHPPAALLAGHVAPPGERVGRAAQRGQRRARPASSS